MESFITLFERVRLALFEGWVEPVMFAAGLGNLLEDGFDATGWLLVGVLQLLVIFVLIGPMQRWRPVQAITDTATVRTDIFYTLLHRLGLFRVAMFFALTPVVGSVFGVLRVAGWGTWHLDAWWPGVTDQPWVSLLLYLLAIDFFGYGVHRAQHHFDWWWKLHALHHAQRQLTMWSDNRNHLLDDLVRHALQAILAQLIGVAPGQYVAIVAVTQLSESFQHANLKLWFGRVGERFWISPRFHRLHHAVGTHCNFGVLLPWWDILFGTANFQQRYDPTGVTDQIVQGRDYGSGFWSQQWLGLKRLAGKA